MAVRDDAVKRIEQQKEFQKLSQEEKADVRGVIESRIAREFGVAQETKAIGRKESDALWKSTQKAVKATVESLNIQSPAHSQELQAEVLSKIASVPGSGFDGAEMTAGDVARESVAISNRIVDTVRAVVREKKDEVGVEPKTLQTFEVRPMKW